MGVTNDPRWMGNWSQVQIWLANGYDTELDIWPAVASCVERLKKAKRRMPTSLKYFNEVIAEHHQARIANAPVPKTGPAIETIVVKRGSPDYAAYLEDQRRQGKRTAFLETREALTVPLTEIQKLRGVG